MNNLSEIKPQHRKRLVLSDRGNSVKCRKLTEWMHCVGHITSDNPFDDLQYTKRLALPIQECLVKESKSTELALSIKPPQLPFISVAPFFVDDEPKPANTQMKHDPNNASENPKLCLKKQDRKLPGTIQKDLQNPKIKKDLLYGERKRRDSRSFCSVSDCTTRSEGRNRFGNAKTCRKHLISEYPGSSEIERELEALGNSGKSTDLVSVLAAVEENMGQLAGAASNCSSQASSPRRNRFLRDMRRVRRDSSSGNLYPRLPNVGPENPCTW